MPFKGGIEAHTGFPGNEKLDDELKKIPSMPKAPAPPAAKSNPKP